MAFQHKRRKTFTLKAMHQSRTHKHKMYLISNSGPYLEWICVCNESYKCLKIVFHKQFAKAA